MCGAAVLVAGINGRGSDFWEAVEKGKTYLKFRFTFS